MSGGSVVLATRYAGDYVMRTPPEFNPQPVPAYPGWTPVGAVATADQITGLPAVGAAIRLNAETVASLPLMVYRGRDENRTRAIDSWQWQLLHDEEEGLFTTVNVLSDVSASLDTAGNAYCLKVKDPTTAEVIELLPLPPLAIDVKLVNGQKVFVYRGPGSPSGGRTLTTAQVLHVRGFSFQAGALKGMSPLDQHRWSLAGTVELDAYQGAFFKNAAQLGGVISVPAKLTQEQAEELLDVFEMDHGGQGNAGSTALLHSGATWQQITLSQQDAQYVESRRMGIGDVARIFRVPVSLLDDAPDATSPEAEATRYLKFGLGPRLKMIERAFASDPDMFRGSGLYPEFLADALARASTIDRFEAYRRARQAGWLTANEIRAAENYPPVPGGDDIQQTPVGGAPNAVDATDVAAALNNGRAHDPDHLQRVVDALLAAEE